MKCPICLSSKSDKILEKYLLCVSCKTLFLKDFPTSKQIRENNESDAPDRITTDFNDVSIIYAKRLEELRKHTKGRRILDIGYGNGVFMQLADREGLDVSGVEFPNILLNFMKKKGFKVSSNIKDFNRIKFDAVVNFDVIEHTTDPGLFLREIRKVLKKGGVLMITTPNSRAVSGKFMKNRYFVFDPVKHYIIFSSKSLALLIRSNGYKVLEVKTDIITPWFHPTGMVKNKILNRLVYLAISPFQDFLFEQGLGDNLQIIAKKI